MTHPQSAMSAETRETPEAVARLLANEGPAIATLGRKLARLAPPVVATCARGSSDHAASYLKYLLEITAGTPVASIGPSVASVYHTRLRLAGGLLVSISQSGRSPDLVALQAAARDAGALTVAIVNVTDSPLAQQADTVIALHAGPERSVAATKSFVGSLVAAAVLAAAWSDHAALRAAVNALPATLEQALHCDWSAASEALEQATSLYVLGRGPGFPVALEAALKCKEVAAIHAEAFSIAEVMHGPLRLVHERFPVLAFLPDDAAAPSNRAGLADIARAGGRLFTASPLATPGTRLPSAATGHGFTDPIAMVVSFYCFIEAVARARSHDPDHPAHLRKVTKTL